MQLTIEVPPSIVPGANIYLVGEAPGEQEVLERRGFVGPAGELLDQMMHVAGLSRSSISISNVVKRRPPDNDFSIFYEDKAHKVPTEELLEWCGSLRDELSAHQPNIVVAAGNEALRARTTILQPSSSAARGAAGHCEATRSRGRPNAGYLQGGGDSTTRNAGLLGDSSVGAAPLA